MLVLRSSALPELCETRLLLHRSIFLTLFRILLQANLVVIIFLADDVTDLFWVKLVGLISSDMMVKV